MKHQTTKQNEKNTYCLRPFHLTVNIIAVIISIFCVLQMKMVMKNLTKSKLGSG